MLSSVQLAESTESMSFVNSTRRHVLDLDDFSLEEMDLVFTTTDAMREVLGRDIKKVPTLRGKVIVTLFYEASTRTRVSFEEAGKILSADVINVAASGSSIEKGEPLFNTVRTEGRSQARRLLQNLLSVDTPHTALWRERSPIALVESARGILCR